MADKEAVVKARLDGVEETSRGFDQIKSSAASASSGISSGMAAAGNAIRDSVQGVLTDISHVVTAAGAINFAGSVAQVHQFEDSVARMAVRTRQSVSQVQGQVDALSGRINEMPNQTAAWVSAVSKLTYSYEGASLAAEGAAQYAALVGESAEEVAPLVVAIEQLSGASGKSSHYLGVMVEQARELGTVGGPKALGDMFEHLRGQLGGLADDTAKTTALMAGFGGNKGFTPQQRERALGNVMSRIEGNTIGFERFLGHSITDEFGHVKDMAGTIKELQQYGKRGRGQERRLQFTFDKEGTAAIMHTDFAAVQAAEKAQPGLDAAAALGALEDTAAGRRKAAEVQKAVTMQKTVGAGSAIGDLSDWIGRQAAEHPILTGITTTVGASLVAKGAGSLMGAAAKGLLGGGGAEATKAGTGLALEQGGGALSGAAGLGLMGVGAGIMGFSYWAAHQNDELVDKLGTSEADFQRMAEEGEASKQRRASLKRRAGGVEFFAPGKAPSYAEALGPAAPGREAGFQALAEAGAAELRLPPGSPARVPGTAQAASGQAQPDAKVASLVSELVKAGASLQAAQEAAAKAVAAQGAQPPIQIEVVNATGGDVQAHVRGEQ